MADSSSTPRRILVGGTADGGPPARPAAGAPAPNATSSSPPPWKRVSPPTVPDARRTNELDVVELERRIRHNDDALRHRLAVLLGRLDALRARFDDLSAHARADAATATDAAASEASRIHTDQTRGLEARRSARERELTASVSARVRAMAGGAASGASDVPWVAEDYSSPLRRYQRIGGLAVPSGSAATIPALHPLRIGGGWIVEGDGDAAGELVLGALVRLVAQSSPGRLRIHAYDPLTSGRLAPLAGLRAVDPAMFPPPVTRSSAMVERIHETVRAAAQNVERVAAGGARDFVELWEQSGGTEGTLSVMVVLDHPYGVSGELESELQRLARLGPASGTVLLVHGDPRIPAPDGVDAAALRALLPRIEVTTDRIRAAELGDLPIVPDARPSRSAIDELVKALRARAALDTGRTVELGALLGDELERPWTRSSRDALDTVLGVAGRERLEISFRTENPPHANALLGGMVGTGKSNVLKDLVYSAAVRYSPDELDLVLLDFKAGIEFKGFDADESGEGWLPHVSVLGLESDQEYGVAVLRHVADELDRRARLFKAAGSASLARYREASGRTLPRLLVVIDEFHMILEGDDDLAEQAADLLELIAKQGRAFGVHLLLASQTLSGITGLRTKGDAIFAQFPVRVSLKNSASESQLFLSHGNTAAAELAHRGEVIVNRNLGQQPEHDNVRGLAAYADQARLTELQHALWRRNHERRPAVFLGADFATWDLPRLGRLSPDADARPGIDLWLGRGVAVSDAPVGVRLRDDADQLVAIVGADQGRDRVVPGLVAGIVVTAARQLPRGSEIVILDAAGDDTVRLLATACATATDAGISVTTIPAPEIAAHLTGVVGPRLDRPDAPRMLLIGLGLQRVRGLDDAPERDDDDAFSFGLASAPTARDVIADVAARGAVAGVGLVGWWSNVSGLEQTVGLAHRGVAAYVTAGAGLEDLKTLAGPLTKKLAGSPRVGLIDRNGESRLLSVVPFELWNDAHASRLRGGGHD